MTGGLLRRFLSAMMENSDMKIVAAGKIGHVYDADGVFPESVNFTLSAGKTTFTYCFGGAFNDSEAVLKGAGKIYLDTNVEYGSIAVVTNSSISLGEYEGNEPIFNFIVFEIDE